MKLILTLCILFAAIHLQAQSYLGALQSLTNTEVMRDRTKVTEMDLSKIKGSPFAKKDFIHGTVYVNDTVLARNVPLRYNIFEDIIEVQFDKNDLRPIQRNKNIEAQIGNVRYIFIDSENKYFTKLTDSNQGTILLKKTDIEYREEVQPENTYVKGKPAEFIHNQTYFMFDGDKLVELPNKKRLFFKAFSPKDNEIEKYYKSNKLSLNEEEDLIKIINYYNSN